MNMPQQKPGRSKQDYGTPPEFLEAVKRRLMISHFERDLAASVTNAVSPVFFSEEDDALSRSWDDIHGWQWCNPPYGHIEPWVAKAYRSSKSQIAMLLPASVGSNWWDNWVDSEAHVLFLKGRLSFVGETAPYPKDCALLLYTPYVKGGYEIWNWRQPCGL